MARRHRQQSQRGAALLVFLVLLVMAALSYIVNNLASESIEVRRAQKTSDALMQAKEALISYTVSRNLAAGSARPGDLPCPDTTNSGNKGTSCGNQIGSTGQAYRLGRLPWRDLGLPKLTDGYEETLWYAVSNNFKENTRIDRLNSDTMRFQSTSLFVPTAGSITVREGGGGIIYDGSSTTGVVAVIIAPGPAITRQDGVQQVRSAANLNDPVHYLDNIVAGEDNANFSDNSTNGFFYGPVRNNQRAIIANDRILTVTLADIAAAMEKRVAGEVTLCLSDYAFQNQGRLPWAASMAQTAVGNYADVSGNRFGRLPASFSNTHSDSGNAMMNNWTGKCMINSGNMWFMENWREIVLYAVADELKPVNPLTPGSCGICIEIRLPAPATPTLGRGFAVLVAGRSQAGQNRSSAAHKTNVNNYLEGHNSTPSDDIFEIKPPDAGFNDRVRYWPQ